MAPQDLARMAAEEIVVQVGRADTRAPLQEQIARIVQGAISRALDEAGPEPASLIQHVHHPGFGGVDVKLTRSTQGVALEVDVKRPRDPSETYEQAARASAKAAGDAYRIAQEEIAALGLVPGKEPRA